MQSNKDFGFVIENRLNPVYVCGHKQLKYLSKLIRERLSFISLMFYLLSSTKGNPIAIEANEIEQYTTPTTEPTEYITTPSNQQPGNGDQYFEELFQRFQERLQPKVSILFRNSLQKSDFYLYYCFAIARASLVYTNPVLMQSPQPFLSNLKVLRTEHNNEQGNHN